MKKIKKHKLRLSTRHSRFPWDMVAKGVDCKYCGRTPLVEHFDFFREIDGKKEACCVECYDAGRGYETSKDTIAGLGYILSGLKNYDFPWAPEKGTPKKEIGGYCDTCKKPVFYNPYTSKWINGYRELLRDIVLHNNCKLQLPPSK
jgi:hypothetical protein